MALLFITATTAQNIADDEFTSGVLRQASTDDILYPSPAACGSGQLTICVGCRTVKICVGTDDTANPTQICPSSAPFCNIAEGGCSTIPDDTQDACSEASENLKFRCTGKGKYPDPLSCEGYYYCSGVDRSDDAYRCPSGYTFNSKVQLCQRYYRGCQTVNCTTNGPIIKVYPPNSQYFYYCQYNFADSTTDPSIVMFSCGDSATFDTSANKCIYKCRKEGLYAKSSNPNAYYQCYWYNGRLTYIERSCPQSTQVFDDTKKLCLAHTGDSGKRHHEHKHY
ncbi:uncharacterized protein LOC129720324 [Wyeomyia smithii]|uniref:uncharacterized protein LOC129720324 n=1 Tax=Wyeomyia smithii TaxID=174621 RepID=UPI002467B610|nr:uncharacterized protein LOC129720324 [Wyeomyia smithii]